MGLFKINQKKKKLHGWSTFSDIEVNSRYLSSVRDFV